MTAESEFTPVSEWCAHPQDWNAPDADATEDEVTVLVAAFVRALQPELVLETGTHTGHTAKAIGTALVLNGHGSLVTVEQNRDLAAVAAHRCRDLPVHVLVGDSLSWRPGYGATIDFGWFDSDAHIRHWEIANLYAAGAFSPGAIIGIHDTAPHHPVHDYLKPLVDAEQIRPIRLRTPRGVTFAEVLA